MAALINNFKGHVEPTSEEELRDEEEEIRRFRNSKEQSVSVRKK